MILDFPDEMTWVRFIEENLEPLSPLILLENNPRLKIRVYPQNTHTKKIWRKAWARKHLIRWRNYGLFLGHTKRTIFYTDGSILRTEGDLFDKEGILFGDSDSAIFEHVYNLIFSWLGEHLERVGCVRLHGLGTLNQRGHAVVALGLPGAGKSTSALNVLQTTQDKLFGDELVLIRGDMILPAPMPLRIVSEESRSRGINKGSTAQKKIQIKIPDDRVAESTRCGEVILLERGNKSRFPKLTLLFLITTGIGLTQMTEHMLRIDNISQIIQTVFARLRFWIQFVFLR